MCVFVHLRMHNNFKQMSPPPKEAGGRSCTGTGLFGWPPAPFEAQLKCLLHYSIPARQSQGSGGVFSVPNREKIRVKICTSLSFAQLFHLTPGGVFLPALFYPLYAY